MFFFISDLKVDGGERVQHVGDDGQPVEARHAPLGERLPRFELHQNRGNVLWSGLLSIHGHALPK